MPGRVPGIAGVRQSGVREKELGMKVELAHVTWIDPRTPLALGEQRWVGGRVSYAGTLQQKAFRC